MNLLSDLDLEFIDRVAAAIIEKEIKLEDLYIEIDRQAIRERRFGIFYYGGFDNIGGSADMCIYLVKDKSRLFRVCGEDIELFGDMMISLIEYKLENGDESA